MPSKPRPKKFHAVRPFSCAGDSFDTGDEVKPSTALTAALRHGDKFVEARHAKPAEPTDPTPDPADTGATNKES